MIPKFRAWHKEYKQMRDLQEIRFDYLPEPNVLARAGGKDIAHRFDIVWPYSEIELMQWTGWQDRQGKDIYAGDILHLYADADYSGEYCPYIVALKDYGWMVTDDDGDSECLADVCNCSDIIGNIYENPELLEQKC